MYKRNGLMASVLVTSATPQGSSSSDSLEGQSCDYASKSYDAVVFDVLKVTPEEFASQITLMDIPVFKAIQPEELASCGWSKKEQTQSCPQRRGLYPEVQPRQFLGRTKNSNSTDFKNKGRNPDTMSSEE
nr:unnamed protein product [Mus musculus]